jgi:hypothetical protein
VELPDLRLEAVVHPPLTHARQPHLDRHVEEHDQVRAQAKGGEDGELADGVEG